MSNMFAAKFHEQRLVCRLLTVLASLQRSTYPTYCSTFCNNSKSYSERVNIGKKSRALINNGKNSSALINNGKKSIALVNNGKT